MNKEKEKRYDEALEIAKKNYISAQDLCEGSQIGVECFKNTLENIFPELKESEDEEMIKWIIDDIRYNINNETLINSEYTKKAERAIAWLEKQNMKKTIRNKEDEENMNNIFYIFNQPKESEDEKVRKWLITQLELKSDVNNPRDLELMILKSIDWLERQGKQVSVWNEEDIFKVQRICKYLNEAKKYYGDITEVRECIDWLKSLEDRYT